MNIGVNARLLLHNKLEGIGWYASQILSRMVRNHPEHTFYFFFDRPYDESFIFAPNVKPIVVGPEARHPLLYHVWFNWKVAPKLRKLKIDVFFSPEGLMSHRSKVPTVIAIHDLAYLHYPKQIDKAHLYYLKKYQPLFAKKATKVITVSEFTKQDLIEKYHLAPEKIAVVYNAANPIYRPINEAERTAIKKEISGGREYFLFVGALHPRKNIINLLKAFVKFKRRQKCGLKLVIVGRMAWKTQEIEEAQRRMPYREDVVWLGYQDVKDLMRITAAAYALVYPSLFEGFGVPIIEAMACNVPSIVSHTSSMPEVAGTAALICDPEDPADIAEQMGILYKNESLRAELAANCATEIKRFDWDVSAEQVWDLLSAHSKKPNSK